MYTPVKQLIAQFKNPVDWDKRAKDKAKKLVISVDDVKKQWENSKIIGETIHSKLIEQDMKNKDVVLEGYVGSCTSIEDILDKSKNSLENRKTYLEKLLFSNKYFVLGYADKVIVSRGTIDIVDTKCFEKLYRKSSFKADNGFKIEAKKMLYPLNHLDDCNYIHAVLQVSIYMYLAWENNKSLKVGKLYIRHITPRQDGKIASDELLEVPYLKKEALQLLKYNLINK